uniref:Uncharacterized protein n=1 Tax=Heterorhabditis bacteriophora TaxID=37862 RepID=A0A1I7WWE0_HETBA
MDKRIVGIGVSPYLLVDMHLLVNSHCKGWSQATKPRPQRIAQQHKMRTMNNLVLCVVFIERTNARILLV